MQSYNVYLYQTSALSVDAPAIKLLNKTLRTNATDMWRDYAIYMCKFNTQAVAETIKKLTGEQCCIACKKPPYAEGDIQYMLVSFPYERALRFLPVIHSVAVQNGLVLYDLETKNVFYQDLVDPAFLSVKKRIEDFRRAILNDMAPVWSMRKIGVCREDRHRYSYVVTLSKDPARPFIQRCEAFYLCLKKALTDEETLETRDECFTVFGPRYSISFSLEGYKKRPDQMGYYEWKSPRVKPLNRMGCTEAFFWIKKNGIALPSILERMNFNEMVRAYPNPADRFVASVNITKWQCDPKRSFKACYCAISPGHEEVAFHVVPHHYYKNEKSISALMIGSESAAPILSVIKEFYPYFYARCFLEPNHLPLEMWRKIVEAAAQKKKEYLKEKSYTEAKILDVFIRWSEAQLEEYCVTADGYMFNITGYDIWY